MGQWSSRRAKPLHGERESAELRDVLDSWEAYALAYFVWECPEKTTRTSGHCRRAGQVQESIDKVRERKEAHEGHAPDASLIARVRACRSCAARPR